MILVGYRWTHCWLSSLHLSWSDPCWLQVNTLLAVHALLVMVWSLLATGEHTAGRPHSTCHGLILVGYRWTHCWPSSLYLSWSDPCWLQVNTLLAVLTLLVMVWSLLATGEHTAGRPCSTCHGLILVDYRWTHCWPSSLYLSWSDPCWLQVNTLLAVLTLLVMVWSLLATGEHTAGRPHSTCHGLILVGYRWTHCWPSSLYLSWSDPCWLQVNTLLAVLTLLVVVWSLLATGEHTAGRPHSTCRGLILVGYRWTHCWPSSLYLSWSDPCWLQVNTLLAVLALLVMVWSLLATGEHTAGRPHSTCHGLILVGYRWTHCWPSSLYLSWSDPCWLQVNTLLAVLALLVMVWSLLATGEHTAGRPRSTCHGLILVGYRWTHCWPSSLYLSWSDPCWLQVNTLLAVLTLLVMVWSLLATGEHTAGRPHSTCHGLIHVGYRWTHCWPSSLYLSWSDPCWLQVNTLLAVLTLLVMVWSMLATGEHTAGRPHSTCHGLIHVGYRWTHCWPSSLYLSWSDPCWLQVNTLLAVLTLLVMVWSMLATGENTAGRPHSTCHGLILVGYRWTHCWPSSLYLSWSDPCWLQVNTLLAALTLLVMVWSLLATGEHTAGRPLSTCHGLILVGYRWTHCWPSSPYLSWSDPCWLQVNTLLAVLTPLVMVWSLLATGEHTAGRPRSTCHGLILVGYRWKHCWPSPLYLSWSDPCWLQVNTLLAVLALLVMVWSLLATGEHTAGRPHSTCHGLILVGYRWTHCWPSPLYLSWSDPCWLQVNTLLAVPTLLVMVWSLLATGEHTAGRPHSTCHGRPHCAVIPQGPCHYRHRSGRLPRWCTSLSAHQGVLPSQGHQQCYGCVTENVMFLYVFVKRVV